MEYPIKDIGNADSPAGEYTDMLQEYIHHHFLDVYKEQGKTI